jgi:hypothetical protein
MSSPNGQANRMAGIAEFCCGSSGNILPPVDLHKGYRTGSRGRPRASPGHEVGAF